ncbi:hypothetical protein ACFYON_24905, partial [Micromonospora sp. NPDC005686]|uniref:hypothetical protein n=1 Tax=Micromonospora sp. NPDC005686 TaxID=3364233 RepID=UPI003682E27B
HRGTSSVLPRTTSSPTAIRPWSRSSMKAGVAHRLDDRFLIVAAKAYTKKHGSVEAALEALDVQKQRKYERYESYLDARAKYREEREAAK